MELKFILLVAVEDAAVAKCNVVGFAVAVNVSSATAMMPAVFKFASPPELSPIAVKPKDPIVSPIVISASIVEIENPEGAV